MCGITGYWNSQHTVGNSVVQRMANCLHHRGPDDAGFFIDEGVGFAMAQRRLAVIDLSPAGHQPMISPCGRFVLVYNGEIYNNKDLRIRLEHEGGHFDWRGHSDTETLLAALRHWDFENALQYLNGMFAFALWDKADRKLYLARDRLGEKPLYYGKNASTFLFGSELKSFPEYPGWQGVVDRNALTLYLRHNYIPTPWSIYNGIRKLPPAHYVTVTDNGKSVSEPQCYWNFNKVVQKHSSETKKHPTELVDELDHLLRDAVGRRMVSDVPLGAFLSGGIDSSTIVALMQAQSTRPVKTFTIGFHEDDFNEAKYAKAVAEHLGTDHTELYLNPQECLDVISQLSTIWDEPFSDSSQIPTLLISRLARQNVTVALSGDGGDELFCGYDRYSMANKTWPYINRIPISFRFTIANLLSAIPNKPLNAVERLMQKRGPIRHLADRLPKFAEILKERTCNSYYRHLISHWKEPQNVVVGGYEPKTILNSSTTWPKLYDYRELMMYLDTKTYLPDDILTKVDRASMSISLEARVPMLDHRVVEFAWKVPIALKHQAGQGKWLLRQVLYQYVPQTLIDRPKMGFSVPIDSWLKGPLYDWAEALLDEKRLNEEGFFNPNPIRRMWQEHITGKRRWHYYLWDILMFQEWLQSNKAK